MKPLCQTAILVLCALAAADRDALAQDTTAKHPLVFEANVGQLPRDVDFTREGPDFMVGLTRRGAAVTLRRRVGSDADAGAVSAMMRMTLIGARRDALPVPLDRLPGFVNRYVGSNRSLWRSRIPTYGRVKYRGVYRGIDLVYHGDGRRLEYDFMIAPHADPGDIVLRFTGGTTRIDARGALVIDTSAGAITQPLPAAWQDVDGARRKVPVDYVQAPDGTVTFRVGDYDARHELVIDPVIQYSSFLGAGGNALRIGNGERTAFDAAGFVYVATTISRPGDTDVMVTKLSTDGRTTIYTTYIGGARPEQSFGVAVSGSGQAAVVGETHSTDFPTTPNAFQKTAIAQSGQMPFAAILDANGAIATATYLGANGGAHGVVWDRGSGFLLSGNTLDEQTFPRVGDGGSTFSGSGKAFLSRLLPAGPLTYSTLVRGAGDASALTLGPDGSVYMAGAAYSATLPTTPGAYRTKPFTGACIGIFPRAIPESDLFVLRLSAALDAAVYGTLFGKTASDPCGFGAVNGIDVGADGAAYVVGWTSSTTFAFTTGGTPPVCPEQRFCPSGFLVKLNPAGTALGYSRLLLGSHGTSTAAAVAVGPLGRVYVTGSTTSTDFPVLNAQQPVSQSSRVYVSSDAGLTWRPTRFPSALDFSSSALGFTSAGIGVGHSGAMSLIYATNGTTVWKSVDAGLTWTLVLNRRIASLAVDPLDGGIVYGAGLRSSGFGTAVWKTTDGGTTWTETAINDATPASSFGSRLVIDPNQTQTLYLAQNRALLKSLNGGASWNAVGTNVDLGFIQQFVLAPSNSSVAYVVAAGRLFRSQDGSVSFSELTSLPANVFGVAVSPSDADVVFATRTATAANQLTDLLKSVDGGQTWSAPVSGINGLSFTTSGPTNLVFRVYDDLRDPQLVRSTETLAPTDPIVLAASVTDVKADPQDPSFLVAAAGPRTEAVVVVTDPDGTIAYSSYLGAGSDDEGAGIAVSADGLVSVVGRTQSRSFPLVNAQHTAIPDPGPDEGFITLMRPPLATPLTVMDPPQASGFFTNLSGWAADPAAPAGTGIDAIHVWAFPAGGGAARFLGVAPYGVARPDVAQRFGSQFLNSGYTFTVKGLPAGPYQIVGFARSTALGIFVAQAAAITVTRTSLMIVDAPQSAATLFQPFRISGWALDSTSPGGSGIDAVHVWAYPSSGPPRFVGAASVALPRPDVGAVFGSEFTNSGFSLDVTGLTPGTYTLVVFAHSIVTGAFDLARVVPVRLPDGGAMVIDDPQGGSQVTTPFAISGWAIDRQGSGAGVDAVDVWAFRVTDGSSVFLGRALQVLRPDVGAFFGDHRFDPGGFTLTIATLPSGEYDLIAFGRSTVTGAFSIARVVRVMVN